MKRVYLFEETPGLIKSLNGTYREILAALRIRKPGATSLIEDCEMETLHDCLALIQAGQIRIKWMSGDQGSRFLVLTIKEK